MLTLLLATPGILLADDGVASAGESPILELVTIASYVLAPISILVLWRTRFWRALNVDGVALPTPWRLSAPAGVGLFVGSFLFGGIGASLAKAALSPDVDPLLGGALLNWGSVLGMAVAGVAAAILWKGAPRVEGGGPLVDLRSSMIMALIAAILVIPLVQASSSLGQFLQILLSGTTPSPLGHETLRLMASSTDNAVAWWLVAGAAVLGAPVVEEIIYRGFLQQSARKVGVGPIWASIMIGGFFALMHLPALPVDSRMAGLSGLLVFGTGLGLLRERTGRLDACILVHAVFNAFNLILATAIG
ncbi:MAG: CPBP family intramembrane metalloprotease [Phycisphaera sp.]|nr:CPBP family intramembrane metalloprotease [Phycisphaera sp.]